MDTEEYSIFRAFYACFLLDYHRKITDLEIQKRCRQAWNSISKEERTLFAYGSPSQNEQIYFKLRALARDSRG